MSIHKAKWEVKKLVVELREEDWGKLFTAVKHQYLKREMMTRVIMRESEEVKDHSDSNTEEEVAETEINKFKYQVMKRWMISSHLTRALLEEEVNKYNKIKEIQELGGGQDRTTMSNRRVKCHSWILKLYKDQGEAELLIVAQTEINNKMFQARTEEFALVEPNMTLKAQ